MSHFSLDVVQENRRHGRIVPETFTDPCKKTVLTAGLLAGPGVLAPHPAGR
jgi:hypothetical protein